MPFIEAAVTSRMIAAKITDPASGVSGDFEQSGVGFSLGAGFNYFFSRAVALNIGLDFTGGSFDDAKFEGNTLDGTDGSANSMRVNVGVTWYPQKR